MRLKKYNSDISASGWQGIEKLLIVQRKSKWDLKEIVNAIFYITKNGCVWPDLPGEFAPWQDRSSLKAVVGSSTGIFENG